MSKRSNQVIAGRGFGKKNLVLAEKDAVIFAVTISALQIAIDRLSELDPSKSADEWRNFLMDEAFKHDFSD
jgi:hypothetical protein